MKKIGLLLFSFFVSNAIVFSQSLLGDVDLHLNLKIDSLPLENFNNYTTPTAVESLNWENTIQFILNKNISDARNEASNFNFQIVEFTDSISLEVYYILEEKTPKEKYWGTYIFNLDACRKNLVLQAPHPKFDTNTGDEAIFCFSRLSASALFLSGTHRCNNAIFSDCSGTTSVCSASSSSYRISDMAHNNNTVFQKTTEVLNLENDSAVFVQFHGFSKQSSDPFVILSNGTRKTPSLDYISLLKSELVLVDDSLTFKIAHIDTNWNRLIGFTNTQGRFLNGSLNPCSVSAQNTNGNFIHSEQEKTRLRQDSLGWNKVKIALENVFPCKEIPINIVGEFNEKQSLFPNPIKGNKIFIPIKNIKQIQLFDVNNKQYAVVFKEDKTFTEITVSDIERGVYFLKIESNMLISFYKFLKE